MEIKHYQTPTMENPKMVWILGISCKIKIDVAKKWAKFLETIYDWVYFCKCAGLWSATLLKDKRLHRYF